MVIPHNIGDNDPIFFFVKSAQFLRIKQIFEIDDFFFLLLRKVITFKFFGKINLKLFQIFKQIKICLVIFFVLFLKRIIRS